MYKSFQEIRQNFLDFFKKKNHFLCSESSLVYSKDNSILFTNAGMNQFKDIFLGLEKIKYNKIVSIQKCLRVGGKHNDLNNIGYSYKHNTFFEMMGNFSFNSYFKKESILFAWELLTSKKWFNLSKNSFIVTVHISDIETYNIWLNLIKIPSNRIFILGKEKKNIFLDNDNIWKMSKFGPFGVCTEIFYDFSYKKYKNFNDFYFNNNRFLEIWNLVFIEYNYLDIGKILPLSKKYVDTGMGLERIACVLQNVNSNFKIDIFKDIIFCLLDFFKIKMNKNNKNYIYIISDHIRSIIFIILCNIIPSNEGRGYVLRKIIRRILVNIRLLGFKDLILFKLINSIIYILKKYYSNFNFFKIDIKNIIYNEELKFFNSFNYGLDILNLYINKCKKNNIYLLNGKIIFYLYDTLGFPLDLIKYFCFINNLKIDIKNFNKKLNYQKIKSIKNSKFNKINLDFSYLNIKKTIFLNLNSNKNIKFYIVSIFVNNKNLKKIYKNDKGILIFNKTYFFPESGGQKGDVGYILNKKGSKFIIEETKILGIYIIHLGYVFSGSFNLMDNVFLFIDKKNRLCISRNHTATHLLFFCIKKILNNFNIIQKGSFICNKFLHFDFSYDKKLSDVKIYKIEFLLNKIINDSLIIKEYYNYNNIDYKLFNFSFFDKNKIRIIKIGSISKEFCCGTHVSNTKDIELFFIKKEYGISSGIRRIKAVTSNYALKEINTNRFLIKKISNCLSISNKDLYFGILNILKDKKLLIKKLNREKNYNIKNIINLFYKKDFIIIKNKNFLIKDINFIFIDKINIFLFSNKLLNIFNLFILIFLKKYNKKKYIYIFFNKYFKNNFNLNMFFFNFLCFFKFKLNKNIFNLKISKNFIYFCLLKIDNCFFLLNIIKYINFIFI